MGQGQRLASRSYGPYTGYNPLKMSHGNLSTKTMAVEDDLPQSLGSSWVHRFIASHVVVSIPCWRINRPSFPVIVDPQKWKANESFYVHRIHSPISFMVILNIAQRMENPSFLAGKSSNSMMGHLNMGLNHSKVSVHRLKKSSSFNVFPQISIYLHICPNKKI